MRLWYISCEKDGDKQTVQRRVPNPLFRFSQNYFAVNTSLLIGMVKELPKSSEDTYLCKTVGAWKYMVCQKDAKQYAAVADTELTAEQIQYFWNKVADDEEILHKSLSIPVLNEAVVVDNDETAVVVLK